MSSTRLHDRAVLCAGILVVRYVIMKYIPFRVELTVDYYLRGNQVGEIPYHVFGLGGAVESGNENTATGDASKNDNTITITGGKQSWMPELNTIVRINMVFLY